MPVWEREKLANAEALVGGDGPQRTWGEDDEITSAFDGRHLNNSTVAVYPGSGAGTGSNREDTSNRAGGFQAATATEQDVTEGPVEPVMSGPFPVISAATEDRGRQVFQMFNHSEGSQIWALLIEPLRKRAGTEARFVEFNKKLRERMGPETQMLKEDIVPVLLRAGYDLFARLLLPAVSHGSHPDIDYPQPEGPDRSDDH